MIVPLINLGTQGIERGAAGWEACMQPLSYARFNRKLKNWFFFAYFLVPVWLPAARGCTSFARSSTPSTTFSSTTTPKKASPSRRKLSGCGSELVQSRNATRHLHFRRWPNSLPASPTWCSAMFSSSSLGLSCREPTISSQNAFQKIRWAQFRRCHSSLFTMWSLIRSKQSIWWQYLS